MLDFMTVEKKFIANKGYWEVNPVFLVQKTEHLMIRGGDFYAIWDEEKGLWSTDFFESVKLIDKELSAFYEEHKKELGPSTQVNFLRFSSNKMIDRWRLYCSKQMGEHFEMLDGNLMFANDKTDIKRYASKRLPYALQEGDTCAWDELLYTLYDKEEAEKIEWSIGSIVNGDSKKIQKFLILYGSPGTGKSTILDIVEQLFEGYTASFDARSLGNSNSQFALESFTNNPLVAIQQDGNLSRIEDNARLNSLVSHEEVRVNEKHKRTYGAKFNTFLMLGTNSEVKITDNKSGILRRALDSWTSGRTIDIRSYKRLKKQIPFELGAIAYKCKMFYEHNKHLYDNYTPTRMMLASNDMSNFIADRSFVYVRDDYVTLNDAWMDYKMYCDEAGIKHPLSKREFKEELKTYFEFYDERKHMDGVQKYNVYRGFLYDIDGKKKSRVVKLDVDIPTPAFLDFKEQPSVFDELCKDAPAQYASVGEDQVPIQAWNKVTNTLKDIDTSKTHYAKVEEHHVVIDFDLKNEKGEKDFKLNLEALSKWPPTYAELSKGGEGIHAHYIYDGDVSKLSHDYDENIEIKVFSGKSSLRRRLSKCNNLNITHLSSGSLPFKKEDCKKEMFDNETFFNEKGLRTTIEKCLDKGVHSSTASNVQYIYKLLEDAYESGKPYDVSDLYNEVVAFAAQSTNQSSTCLDLVSKMHFTSEEPSVSLDDNDKPIVFYDIEVFPNLFLINWKIKGKENPMNRMINPTAHEVEQLLKYRLIGFNNRRYDNHIIYAAMQGYSLSELYHLSQKIINNEPNALFREAYNLSYTDIYDFASAGNKMSLKKLEIAMANDKKFLAEHPEYADLHHEELGLPWDQPVPEELWSKVSGYCDNDVYSTEASFDYLSADWTARQILAEWAGMSVNDTTNTLTTRIIFGNNRNPQGEFCYRNLAEPVTELDPEVEEFLKEKFPEMMSQKHGEAESLLPYFPGYEFKMGKSYYRDEEVGEGGWAEGNPGMYGNVALLDVASMHPHSAMAECLFGPKYTRRYRNVVDGRVNIKHDDWKMVHEMFDGKLDKFVDKVRNGEMTSKQLADALKTAINSVYGLTSAGFANPFKDPRNMDNIVAKRGALFMLDLREAVRAKGFVVAHIKTDSIKIPDATPEIIQFVMDFGKMYGYTFEHEATYDRMCLVNDAVYIAKYKSKDECDKLYGYCPGDNLKHGNEWTATGKQFAVPYVYKKLFTHEELEFADLCETFQVSKGALNVDLNEGLPDVKIFEDLKDIRVKYQKKPDKMTKREIKLYNDYTSMTDEELEKEIAKGHDMMFVGRVGQFTPIKQGCKGGILYRVADGKNYAAPGSTGYRWLESNWVKSNHMENDIDMSFYQKLADNAIDTINRYGDFYWFVSNDPYVQKKQVSSWGDSPTDEEELPFD